MAKAYLNPCSAVYASPRLFIGIVIYSISSCTFRILGTPRSKQRLAAVNEFETVSDYRLEHLAFYFFSRSWSWFLLASTTRAHGPDGYDPDSYWPS
jgi:hypothetical protein